MKDLNSINDTLNNKICRHKLPTIFSGEAKLKVNGKKETLLADEQQLLVSIGGNSA